ncbi:Muscle M-line assembly protein unc-89 [Bulinus truncatus]|nr:Muscle M-line assembly protein unc-89 [Bulinus truncatus]
MTGERLRPAEPRTDDMDAADLSDTESTAPAVLHTALKAGVSAPPQTSQEAVVGTRTFHVNRDLDGGVTLQASAADGNQNRVVTVRTLKQRTPSDANEELRDKIVQKKTVSPGGTVLEEKAVVQTKTKLTSRGSNYYTRSTYTTRTKRDRHGQETVEHNVSVETENKSVSQGQSWGNKVVTSVTLDESGAAPVPAEENGSGGPPITEMVISNRNGSVQGAKEVPKIAPSLSTASAKEIMDAISSVKIEGPPEITQPLSDVTALEGKHVVLTCVIRSTQTAHVTWYKDDVEITQADLYACHYDDREGRATLRIPDATIFDTANYCVVCQNYAGEARTKCSVVIKRKFEKVPTITRALSDITVKEGISVPFVCSVTGAARISWFKDGTVLPASADVQQTYDGQDAQLILNDVLLSDGACYECVASNDCGDASTSCTLTVREDISEDTVVPMFLTRFSDVKAFGGDTLLLDCEVIGSPEPNITWLKDFRDLPTDLSFSTSYDGRVCILQIHNIKAEDSGIYKCIAENAAGKNSIDARVDVIVRKAPHFVLKLEDASVSQGKGVVLRCSVAGTPQPTVSWKRNGSSIGQSPNCIDSYHNGVARLEILRVCSQDTGVYECVAENVVTQAACSCKVTLSEPEAQKSKEDFVVEALPKVTRARTFKKLSEPQPSDIIKAVLQRASSVSLQRTQSFGPSSTSQEELNADVLRQQDDRLSFTQDAPRPTPVGRATSAATPPRPDSLGLMSKPVVSFRSLTSLDITPKADQSIPLPQQGKVTNLGRSVSMHVVRNNTLLSPDSSLSTSKVVWAPKSRDGIEPRETISKASSLEVITESKQLNFIPGYRSVSPVFLTSPDKEKLTSSPLAVSNTTLVTHRPDALNGIIPQSETAHHVPEKTSPAASSSSPTSNLHHPNEISLSKPSVAPASPYSSPSTSTRNGKEESPRPVPGANVVLPRVSQLRLQFLQNDKLAEQQSRPPVSTGAGIKRWHSLPPQDTRPTVVKWSFGSGAQDKKYMSGECILEVALWQWSPRQKVHEWGMYTGSGPLAVEPKTKST